MKKFLKVLLVILLIVLAFGGGYFVGFYKLVDYTKLFNKDTNLTYAQVADILEVVCEDRGFSTSRTSALSSIAFADSGKILEFNINESYFNNIYGLNLNNYIENSDFYSMYDTIINAMSIEISNDTLKLGEVKKVIIDVGTQFETVIYYYLSTKGNDIIIDWASKNFIDYANTGIWADNTCVGYRLTVDYDLDNFDDEKYIVRQCSNIQRTDGYSGYSFVYQNVVGGQIKDCGYSDFSIKKDNSGNIIKETTSSLVLENLDLVNNKCCFLKGTEGQFWYSGEISASDVQEISNDDSMEIVTNIINSMDDINNLSSKIYTIFCA